jgi:hypothetical protein
MNLPSRFSYNGRWHTAIAIALFFSACLAAVVTQAVHAAKWSAAYLWSVAALGGFLATISWLSILRRIFFPREVAFDREGIQFPYGFLQIRLKRINYSDIHSVVEANIQGQKSVVFSTLKDYGRISASLLPDDETYRLIKAFLFTRARPVKS